LYISTCCRFKLTHKLSLEEAKANGQKPAKRDEATPLHNAQLGEPPARKKRTVEPRRTSPQPGTSGAAAGKKYKFSQHQ
jgi:hypothetical protein